MISARVLLKVILFAAAAVMTSTAAQSDVLQRPSLKDHAAPFSWAGFYVGVHGGYGWTDEASASIGLANGATAAFVGPAIEAGAVLTNYGVDPNGPLGGVQVGYNIQIGSLIAGIEADISWMDIQESQVLAPTPFVLNTFATDITWVSTIRSRVGVIVRPTLVIFGTGGLAIADINQSLDVRATNGDAFAGSRSDIVTGWTTGGGVEWALSRNWILKGEYLFVSLDPDSFSTSATGGGCSNVTNNCLVNVTGSDIELHTVSAGIDYKF